MTSFNAIIEAMLIIINSAHKLEPKIEYKLSTS